MHLAKKSNIRIPNYSVKKNFLSFYFNINNKTDEKMFKIKCLLNNSNQTSEKKTSRIVQMKKVLKVQCWILILCQRSYCCAAAAAIVMISDSRGEKNRVYLVDVFGKK